MGHILLPTLQQYVWPENEPIQRMRGAVHAPSTFFGTYKFGPRGATSFTPIKQDPKGKQIAYKLNEADAPVYRNLERTNGAVLDALLERTPKNDHLNINVDRMIDDAAGKPGFKAAVNADSQTLFGGEPNIIDPVAAVHPPNEATASGIATSDWDDDMEININPSSSWTATKASGARTGVPISNPGTWFGTEGATVGLVNPRTDIWRTLLHELLHGSNHAYRGLSGNDAVTVFPDVRTRADDMYIDRYAYRQDELSQGGANLKTVIQAALGATKQDLDKQFGKENADIIQHMTPYTGDDINTMRGQLDWLADNPDVAINLGGDTVRTVRRWNDLHRLKQSTQRRIDAFVSSGLKSRMDELDDAILRLEYGYDYEWPVTGDSVGMRVGQKNQALPEKAVKTDRDRLITRMRAMRDRLRDNWDDLHEYMAAIDKVMDKMLEYTARGY